MKDLNFHASGKPEYLKLIKQKYKQLTTSFKINTVLSSKEKEEALKILKERYHAERRNADYNLFSLK